jgi:2,5-diketo-D-gluconate reductase A
MTSDRSQPAVALDPGGAMPLVGLGTWQMTGARCQAAVRAALEVGYRHIDTATMYGNEREVGRAVRDSGVPREQVFVTTKLPPGAAGRERRTLDGSLRALGMDHVDLWLVHWPPRGRGLVSTWRELLAARDRGLARAVGVSNYSLAQLVEVATRHGVTPAQVVVRWHVDHQVVVIPKSATPERIATNFDVLGFSLSEEELARIDGLSVRRRR